MNFFNMNIGLRQDVIWRLLLLICAISIIIIASDETFATSTSTSTATSTDDTSNDIIGQSLCRLVKNLTGSTARAIATIAIFTVGAGLFVGKMQWPVAAFTAVGVAIVFSAPKLVAFLSGNNADATCLETTS